MGRLRVALLGTPDVRHAGETLLLPSRKALALLVYLMLEGGLHPRDKVADLLWPASSSTDQSRGALRYTLSHLRAAMRHEDGSSHLIEGKDLGFDFDTSADTDCDVRDFEMLTSPLEPEEARQSPVERLAKAMALWRGDFMEGFSLRDAPEFEAWLMRQAESWHRRMEAVLDRMSEAQAADGQLAQAYDTTERWVALSPLDERAYQRGIQVALADGDRARAQRLFEACRVVLERELGVAPAPETEALIAHGLHGAPVVSRLTGSGSMGTRTPADLFILPLVGRAAELRDLVEAFELARSGRANAVVLVGEAGIGKTRLATEFVAWAAAQGADALTGRAFETGGRLPYQPLVDALRPRLDRENAPEDLLSDVWLAEMARILPELADRYPDLHVPVGDEAVARVRLFEAVARLGEALAASTNGPIVLFIDDIQWADTATLDVLRYVARRWAEVGVSIMLLLNTRAEALAADPSLGEWLLGLGRDLAVRRLTLESLGAEETEALVRGLAHEPEGDLEDAAAIAEPAGRPGTPLVVEFASWLFGETGGQPFFVTETLKALLDRGLLLGQQRADGAWRLDMQRGMLDEVGQDRFFAPGVRDLLHTRLAHLSPDAGMLLTAAAILGQGYSFELLMRVTELGEQAALSALDEVLRGSVLRETGGTYQFAHDKIREFVYVEAGETRCRVFHRRAFEALELHGVSPAELAHHAVAAGMNEQAFELSVAAGDAAMRVLAAREAVEHYSRARAIAEARGWSHHLVDLHVRFGKSFVSLAQWADARREFEAALDAIGEQQIERRSAVLQDLLEVSWWTMDLRLLRVRAEELRREGEELARDDLQTAALSWLAPTAAAAGDLAGCISLGEEALARGRALGVAPPPMMHAYLALPYYWLGRIQEAVEHSQQGLATAQGANHTSATLHALPHVGLTLAAAGRYDEAARFFDEARRFGSEYGVGTLLARAIAMSAGYHLDLLDYAGNERLAEEARELARSLNFAPPRISAGLDLILNFARRQDLGRAEKLIDEVDEVIQVATAWHGWLWNLRLAEARAEVALARGDWDGAIEWATQAIEQPGLRRRAKYEALGLITRGRALVAIGRRSDALVDLGRAVHLARMMGNPALLVRAAGAMFDIDGSEALAQEIRATVERIVRAVSDEAVRKPFESAEPVRKALVAAR